ncbi:MAG TPA: NTP transferase domain-containing protein [Polyangiaceae bacterium]
MPGALAVGLFVGGRGSRFGGLAKGNLRTPDGARLIERLETICRAALPGAPLLLVGERAEYADLGLETLADTPAGIGPLGGLCSLVARAAEQGHDAVLALACDLPFVTAELVKRLATENDDADALAPREGGLWYALSARYSVRIRRALDDAVLAREHSLQKLFARLGSAARRLEVGPEELAELRDWDCPDDLRA